MRALQCMHGCTSRSSPTVRGVRGVFAIGVRGVRGVRGVSEVRGLRGVRGIVNFIAAPHACVRACVLMLATRHPRAPPPINR